MARASWWQWDRHLAKQIYIKTLESRLAEPIAPFSAIAPLAIESQPYRRVAISGEYDFAHEMVLRNRRYQAAPGTFVLTPLKIEGTEKYILVSRGFLPLSKSDLINRKQFQKNSKVNFIGLLKEDQEQRFFLAPSDPETGPGKAWVDAWLRVDTKKMSAQLPYPLLPIYAEVMKEFDAKEVEELIVKSSSGREELFFLPSKESVVQSPETVPVRDYPVAVFDTVTPSDIHLGYVFEWGVMAVFTLLIGLVIQLKPRRAIVAQQVQ